MKCSKCRMDFCWVIDMIYRPIISPLNYYQVCLGQWKKHGSETGGYFRCNRYEESRAVDARNEQAIVEAREASKSAQKLNRFVHYYSRYKNHLNSLQVSSTFVHRSGEEETILHTGE
jgi:ankyrin repeat/IBR domain-containing protein 1